MLSVWRETTDVAAFFFSTVVATPVTVTPSSWRTSFSRLKLMTVCSAPTLTVTRLKPIARAMRVTSPRPTRRRNSPFAFERTPTATPTGATCASCNGAPPACVTRPVSSRPGCADRALAPVTNASSIAARPVKVLLLMQPPVGECEAKASPSRADSTRTARAKPGLKGSWHSRYTLSLRSKAQAPSRRCAWMVSPSHVSITSCTPASVTCSWPWSPSRPRSAQWPHQRPPSGAPPGFPAPRRHPCLGGRHARQASSTAR